MRRHGTARSGDNYEAVRSTDESGCDIVTVQKLMDHCDIETTRQYLDPDEALK